MRAAPTAHAARPAPIGRRGPYATPDETIFPWHRPASRATGFGRHLTASSFLPAEIEVAGPLSVSLARVLAKPTVINADIANPFLTTMPQRKSPRCDLLHKGLGWLALNLRNGPENLTIVARSESRPPHRLRFDRHWRRSGPVRADLSHSDLIDAERAAGTDVFLGMSVSVRDKVQPDARIFPDISSRMEHAQPMIRQKPSSGMTRPQLSSTKKY
jgi:hypothetical protein